jgi:hypothetical protein
MNVIFDAVVGGCVVVAMGALAGPLPVVFPASRHPATRTRAAKAVNVEIDRAVVIFSIHIVPLLETDDALVAWRATHGVRPQEMRMVVRASSRLC